MKKTLRCILAAFAALCVSTGLYAQVTTASMSGKVTDANGSVVGAAIIATHTPSGSTYYSVSDKNGNYHLLNIRAGGPYSVRAEMLGYQTVEHQGINVSLADNFNLDFSLKEESLTLDQVVVIAESSTSNMRSDRAGAMTSINRTALDNLPTISRSMEDVVKLTPQAYDSGNGPTIGGGNYRQNFFTIDGAAANNAFGIGQSMPASGSPISMDAIEQMSISITPFDVRQSGFLGGSLNAVTRSGSNKFEGSAYMYYYDQNLRGKKVGENELTLSDELHNVYGFRLGGPIIKNKLFFFANLEIENEVTPGPSRKAATPENPYTNGNDGVARPKAAILDQISEYLQTNYDYATGPYTGYAAKTPGMKALIRLDWNINKNHKLNVRYNLTNSKYSSAPSTSTSGLGNRGFTSQSRTSMSAIYFQNARYWQEQNFSSVVGELNSRFMDGRLNNVLRATYSHQYEPRSVDGGQFPFIDIAVEGNTYTSFGTELFSYGNLRDVSTISVTDELSYTTGIHNFLAGVQFETNNTKNGFQRFGAGYYTISFESEDALVAALNNKTLFDNPTQFAITHSISNPTGQSYPQFNYNQLSLYLQDEMSLSDRFKLSLGLRVEVPTYPSLDDNFNQQVADATFAEHNGNGGKYDTTQLPSTKIMFSPRLGFNWDVTGDRKVVMRGGSGLFTGRLPFVWIVAQAGDAGVLQTTYTNTNSIQDGGIPFMSDRNDIINYLYQNIYHKNVGEALDNSANISSISLTADDLKMPQTWKTSLAVDFNLPGDVLFSLEGIYNYDVNPIAITNIGLKDPVLSNINAFADNRLVWGSYYTSSLKNAYLLENASVNGYYYSATAKLEKRNFHGFNGMAAYTYSHAKSLNDGFGDQVYSAWNNAYTVNGQNIQALGNASYVMPHRLIASLGYKKNYAKHFATALNVFYEGGPSGRYSYTYTANVVGDGGAYNLIYVPRDINELNFSDYSYTASDGSKKVYAAEDQRKDFWAYVNQDKYLKTRKGMYAERNGLVGPWVNHFDVKLTQDFYLTTKSGYKNTLQLGVDVRNIGNLLNKNWGSYYSINKTAILKLASNGYERGGEGQSAVPVYQFQKNGTETLTDTFSKSISTGSTYLVQFSVRYIFQ